MPYSQDLADRIESRLGRRKGATKKKMFGGVGFLIHGNMCCGVYQDWLIVRIGLDGYEPALREPHARVFDITGRVMRGWVMVGPDGWSDDEQLEGWLGRAAAFAQSLPPKEAK